MGLLLQFEYEVATNTITAFIATDASSKLEAVDYRDVSHYLFHWAP